MHVYQNCYFVFWQQTEHNPLSKTTLCKHTFAMYVMYSCSDDEYVFILIGWLAVTPHFRNTIQYHHFPILRRVLKDAGAVCTPTNPTPDRSAISGCNQSPIIGSFTPCTQADYGSIAVEGSICFLITLHLHTYAHIISL